jgi:hypothetical protein
MLRIYEKNWEKADWKQWGLLIRRQARPGDAVFTKPLGFNALALDYYLPESLDHLQDLSTSVPERVFIALYGQVSLDHLPFTSQTTQRWKPIRIYQGTWTSLVLCLHVREVGARR